jgi:hypothetical protein
MNFHTIFFDDIDLGMDSILGIVGSSEDNSIVLRQEVWGLLVSDYQ